MAGFGAFGKIPALGDFFHVNTPKGFVSVWDAWLQEALLAAKGRLAAAWDETYMSAPIWRFTLPAGQAGPAAVMGILMPSVDRVGRQFPLSIVGGYTCADLPLTHFANRLTFEKLEQIALDALQNETSKDALENALGAVVPVVSGAGFFDGQKFAGDVAPDVMLAAQGLGQPGKAVWSCDLGNAHRLLRCNALPTAAEFGNLLNPMAAGWSNTPLERHA